jgi:flagellar hook-associated protein 1 FlgK
MTLNNILSTSLTGLFTNQSNIRATANNVANVNTPGFSRIQVNQEALVLQGESVGVGIGSITRVVDRFLEEASRTAVSNTDQFAVQREFHDRLQGVLGDPASDSSLSARLDQVFQTTSDLALNPSDVLRRQQSVSELENFLSLVGGLQGQLQDLRADVSRQIGEVVTAVNENLQRINELNPLLVRQAALGLETGGVEGQLQQALSELSEYLDFNIVQQDNGAVFLNTTAGQPLLDSSLTQLEYSPPGIVTSETFFPPINLFRVNSDTLEPISSSTDITGTIRSGRLRGLVDLRDTQFVDLSVSIGELGARVADQFNAVQNRFSSVPAPNTLEGRPTIVDGAQATNFTGIVTFAVVDANSNLVARTTVDFDSVPPADFNALIAQVNAGLGGAGTLSLTDGVASLSATAPGNGVVVADDETNPSLRAGRGFSHFFGLNDLIQSDDPGIYETGLTGTENHNVGAGQSLTFRVRDELGRELATVNVAGLGTTYNDVVAALNNVTGLGAFVNFSLNGEGALDFTVNPPRSNVNLELVTDSTQIGSTGLSLGRVFGLAEGQRARAAQDITVVERIRENPNTLGLSVLSTTAAVGELALNDGDQRGALAFQEIETLQVGFEQAGELNAGNVTLSQFTAQFLGNAGLQALRATNLEEDNQALLGELQERLSDITGVNLDEELANLVVFQNAYSAAARVLTSVQELYDSLLNAV